MSVSLPASCQRSIPVGTAATSAGCVGLVVSSTLSSGALEHGILEHAARHDRALPTIFLPVFVRRRRCRRQIPLLDHRFVNLDVELLEGGALQAGRHELWRWCAAFGCGPPLLERLHHSCMMPQPLPLRSILVRVHARVALGPVGSGRAGCPGTAPASCGTPTSASSPSGCRRWSSPSSPSPRNPPKFRTKSLH